MGSSLPLRPISFDFLVEVARGIYQAGDAKSMYMSRGLLPKS
jgi:hypothetical protein